MKTIIIILLSLPMVNFAQECATEPPKRDAQDMFRYRNVQDNSELRKFAVYYTVVGTQATQDIFNEAELTRQTNNLNHYLNGGGINNIPTEYHNDVGDMNYQFRNAGVRRIIDNGDRWSGFASVTTAHPAYQPDKYINIYFLNYAFGGQSIFPSPTTAGGPTHINIVNIGNRNSGTTEHEVGHFVNLYHTFQGGCVSDPCAGDGACDTPPYCSVNNCADITSCCGIPAGSNRWNFMSYNACREFFTKDQVARSRAVTAPGGILNFLVEQDQGVQPTVCTITSPPQPFVVDVGTPYTIAVETDAQAAKIIFTTNDDKSGVYGLPGFSKVNSHGREIVITSRATCYNGSAELNSQLISVAVVKGTPPPPPPATLKVIDNVYDTEKHELIFELEDGQLIYVQPK